MSFNPLLGTRIPWRHDCCSSSPSPQSQACDSWRLGWTHPKRNLQLEVLAFCSQQSSWDSTKVQSPSTCPTMARWFPFLTPPIVHLPRACIPWEVHELGIQTQPRNSLREIVRLTCPCSSDCPTLRRAMWDGKNWHTTHQILKSSRSKMATSESSKSLDPQMTCATFLVFKISRILWSDRWTRSNPTSSRLLPGHLKAVLCNRRRVLPKNHGFYVFVGFCLRKMATLFVFEWPSNI